jgi:hypothetical protein
MPLADNSSIKVTSGYVPIEWYHRGTAFAGPSKLMSIRILMERKLLRRSAALGMGAALFIFLIPARTHACPYCKVAAAGLAENESAANDQSETDFPLRLSGGVDYATRYYFRGYLQGDGGLIVQPYANVFTVCEKWEGVIVRPYVSGFHSSHYGDDQPMREMSDVMAGATMTADGWYVDARYAFYNMAPEMRGTVHELGAKVSYDVLSFLSTCCSSCPFGLRPSAGVYGELYDEVGTEDIYAELGIEGSWRGEILGRPVGFSLPLLWGLSADEYFLDAGGDNATLGYFSAGVGASVPLRELPGNGEWFLNMSLTYLHLFADNLIVINKGNDDGFVAKVGVSFVF